MTLGSQIDRVTTKISEFNLAICGGYSVHMVGVHVPGPDAISKEMVQYSSAIICTFTFQASGLLT